MSAFEQLRYDDFREKTNRGEMLSAHEQREFNTLEARARKEWEEQEPPRLYGGDMVDVF